MGWHCDDCDYGFQTEGELRRHYFDSNQHPSCLKCQRGFVDHAAKKQHLRDSSNHGYCYVCDRGFYDDAALQTHYLKDNKHPNCCGRGFEDADELNAHTKSAHPKPARQAPPSYQAASVQRQTNQTNIEPSSGSVQTPTSNLPTPAVPSQQSPVTVQMSSQELQDAYQKGFEQVIRFITQLQAQSLFPTLAQAPPSQAQIQSQYVPPPAQVVNLPPPIQQLGQAQPVLAEAQVVNAAPQIQPQVQLRPIFAQSQVENSKLQNEAQAQSVHPKAQDKSHELQNGVQPAVEGKSYECLACKAISKDWDTLAEHFTQNSVHKKRHADTRIEQYWNAEEEKRVVTLPEYESSATNKQSSHPTTKVSSVFQPFSFKSNAQSSNTKAEPVSQDAGSSSNGNGSGSGYSKCGINYVKLDESRDHQCGGSKSCENVQEGPSTRSALQTSQWKTEVSSSSSAAQLSVNPFEFIKPTLSSGRQSSARHPGVFNSRIIPNINSISSGSLGQKATNGSGSSAQTKGSYANDLVVIVTENGSVSRIQPPPKPLAQNNAAVPKESYPSKPHEVPVPLAAKDMNPPGHLKLNSPLTNAENLKAHLARKAKEKAEEKEAKSMKQGIENVKPLSSLQITCGVKSCKKQFSTNSEMANHMESGTCLDRDETGMYPRVLDFDRTHSFTVAALIDHLKGTITRVKKAAASHYDTKNMTWNCPYCDDTAFEDSSQLEKHLQGPAHAVKVYRCPGSDCGQRFSRMGSLLKHIEEPESECNAEFAAGVGGMATLNRFVKDFLRGGK